MSDRTSYNPLAKTNLGESVAEALLRVPVLPLNNPANIVGAGVYAIYYTGGFALYDPVARLNVNKRFEQPIYVGKAVPKGGRKGGLTFDAAKGTALRGRLRQHSTSVHQSNNLAISDFFCRFLTVDDIWIPLGENVLIEKFQPLWNRVIDGFGNKDPGHRRATQHRSAWDVLHPGRDFAKKLASNPLSVDDISKRVRDFFAGKLSEADKITSADEGI